MSPKDWRFCFVKYYEPDCPEKRLICEVLSTYFQDIDLMCYRKKYTADEIKQKELSIYKSSSIPPMTLNRLNRYINTPSTKEYCSLLDFSHEKFVRMVNQYMKYRLGFDLSEI